MMTEKFNDKKFLHSLTSVLNVNSSITGSSLSYFIVIFHLVSTEQSNTTHATFCDEDAWPLERSTAMAECLHRYIL